MTAIFRVDIHTNIAYQSKDVMQFINKLDQHMTDLAIGVQDVNIDLWEYTISTDGDIAKSVERSPLRVVK